MSKLKNYAYDWIACIFFLIIPLIMFYQIETSLVEQGVASGGPMQNAATFPRIIAWLMLGLSGLNLFRILFEKVSHYSPFKATDMTGRAIFATVLFVVYLVVLPTFGYYIMTLLLLASLFRLLGLSWIQVAAGAVLSTLAVAFVFEGLLNVVLPVGIFEIALFS